MPKLSCWKHLFWSDPWTFEHDLYWAITKILLRRPSALQNDKTRPLGGSKMQFTKKCQVESWAYVFPAQNHQNLCARKVGELFQVPRMLKLKDPFQRSFYLPWQTAEKDCSHCYNRRNNEKNHKYEFKFRTIHNPALVLYYKFLTVGFTGLASA